MGTIVEFEQFKKRKDEVYRNKMLAKGKVEEYTCNNCGGIFEVIDEKLPDKCPHCGAIFMW